MIRCRQRSSDAAQHNPRLGRETAEHGVQNRSADVVEIDVDPARAPAIFAIWPATDPVAPTAAETTTVSPSFGFPIPTIPK
jgi:hypothetical protein